MAQGPGEIVFVPSGWWHQVENVSDCLSVNHNWINQVRNAESVARSWKRLLC